MNTRYHFNVPRIQAAVRYVLMSIAALLTLAPLWILIVNSFKPQVRIIDNPVAPPPSFDFQYLSNALGQLEFFKSIGFTLFITVFAVFLIVLLSSMAAWIMVRSKLKIAGVLFMAFVAAMLIPFQAIMYPLIQLFDALGLKNLGGLILMYGGFGLSMSMFLYHGFVKSVPLEVEEAAFIDGAHIVQMFFFIVMPLLKSITVTVIIINAMWIWNDYLLPFFVIGNSENKTLVLSLYFAQILAGQYGNPWQLIFPAVLLTITPIVVVFLFLQRFIVKGISAGAVKG
ncbi:MAG: carbohydrate ABC transporter permease [Spirochaetaceae bacterium]|jgi:raffinose/stachyose/melibiose transport system permease protein|nr:carbohydrate ABC transporter permease [Spirochaetaceae bacterium]